MYVVILCAGDHLVQAISLLCTLLFDKINNNNVIIICIYFLSRNPASIHRLQYVRLANFSCTSCALLGVKQSPFLSQGVILKIDQCSCKLKSVRHSGIITLHPLVSVAKGLLVMHPVVITIPTFIILV